MGRRVVLAAVAVLLAGCSSVPDAVNPVEWYRSTRDAITGKDDSNATASKETPPPGANEAVPNLSTVPPRPQTSSAAERQKMAAGLVADRQAASRYSGEVIPRQNTLPQPAPPAPRSPSASTAAASPQSSAAASTSSAPAPSPAQVQAAAPPPPPPAPSSSRATAPTPPPAVTPPSSASQQQAAVPPPGAARTPPQLREVTPMTMPQGTAQPIQPSNIVIPRENPNAPKLAEVKPYVPPPGIDEYGTVYIGGGGTTVVGGRGASTPTSFRTLPPAGTVASEVPGIRPLSAFPGAPRGSQQLATIQFANGSSRLSDRDRAILREVAEQFRKRGGTLRVIGHASSRTSAANLERHRQANARVSADRAEAVARELVRLGVPAGAIYAGAVSDANPKYFEFMPSGEAGNRRAEIFIDF